MINIYHSIVILILFLHIAAIEQDGRMHNSAKISNLADIMFQFKNFEQKIKGKNHFSFIHIRMINIYHSILILILFLHIAA